MFRKGNSDLCGIEIIHRPLIILHHPVRLRAGAADMGF